MVANLNVFKTSKKIAFYPNPFFFCRSSLGFIESDMGTLNCYLVFQSFCFVALYYVICDWYLQK